MDSTILCRSRPAIIEHYEFEERTEFNMGQRIYALLCFIFSREPEPTDIKAKEKFKRWHEIIEKGVLIKTYNKDDTVVSGVVETATHWFFSKQIIIKKGTV